jgi:hypothetical protein
MGIAPLFWLKVNGKKKKVHLTTLVAKQGESSNTS